MSMSRISHLAEVIQQSVDRINDVLSRCDHPQPSFDEDSPASFPLEASSHLDKAIDTAAELHDLLLGPLTLIRHHGGHNNSACLQAISRFGIAAMVPPHGEASFSRIAEQAGLNVDIVSRILRHAITMRIFREPEPGVLAHTQASRLLLDPATNDWLRVGTEEMWPAATKMVQALESFPDSGEPNETGYSLSNDMAKSIYDVMGESPERAARLGNSMKVFAADSAYDPVHLLNHYDWASLGESARVVDVGGAQGHIAIRLAERFKNLDVLVQDMEKVVENSVVVPSHVQGRVRFAAHNLLEPQSSSLLSGRGAAADVVLFRWTLHNWSDKYAIRILRAQIPALRANSKVVVQDIIMPEPGEASWWREKSLRSADLDMAAVFNSRERTVEQWKRLFAEADARFYFVKASQPEGSALGLIEMGWSE